ncbi:MAG TPA: hypothetical protein VFX28_03875, partial [Methylomirabilota bacterium]|nr:hypothetical protein [Methylomirabilota bacterium]
MKIGGVFPDLLTPLGAAGTVEAGLQRTLTRLLRLTGAGAGALVFHPPRGAPLVVTAGARRLAPALDHALRALAATPVRKTALGAARLPGVRAAGQARLLRAPLGEPGRPVGELVLAGRALTRRTLPAGFPRELGTAVAQVWRLHQRTLRTGVLSEITRLLVSGDSLDDVCGAFVAGAASLATFDSLSVVRLDPERAELEVLDVVARAMPGAPARDARLPLEGTLMAELLARGAPRRVDDLAGAGVPAASAARLTA